jgi:hypothetical protein
MQSMALASGTKGQTDWNAINWRKVNRTVRNLRKRIFRATTERNYKKVRSLQKLMLRSYANILTTVRRVTQQNAGRNTPGIDKVVVKILQPEANWSMNYRLSPFGEQNLRVGCTFRNQTGNNVLWESRLSKIDVFKQ